MIKFSIQDLQKAEAEFQKDEAYAPESLLIADAIKSFPNHPKTGTNGSFCVVKHTVTPYKY